MITIGRFLNSLTTCLNINRIYAILFRRNFPGIGHVSRFATRSAVVPMLRTKTLEGNIFYADPRHFTDQEILRNGFYEQQVKNAIFSAMEPTFVFWDVGANTGYHTLMVQHYFPQAKVVSFEPNPESLFRLVQNLKANRFDSIVVAAALAEEVGIRELRVVSSGNSGMTSLIDNDGVTHAYLLNVVTLTGDFVVNTLLAPTPNVLKLDVEGSELSVLMGLTKTLQSGTGLNTIIFEAHTSSALEEIQNFLLPFQFMNYTKLDSYNFIATRSV